MLIDDQRAMNVARLVANEMITRAGSGHPGVALGAAPMLYTLLTKHLVANPAQSAWAQRDRFVLSAGHASALWYTLLHLGGWDITFEDLQQFRQIGSRTPGHPEVGQTPGIDATTGPLGQGLGMAVGMALAERRLNGENSLNQHWTYAFVGDGDLSEGVSHEVADFAGQQRLNRLIVLYDANDVTLDGPLARSSQTDQVQRFKSYGWQVLTVSDGEDMVAIDSALQVAKQGNQPTLIMVNTQIGQFGPYAGTNKAHGTPLSAEQLADLARNLGVTTDLLAEARSFVQAQVTQRLVTRVDSEIKITPILTDELVALPAGAGRDLGAQVLQSLANTHGDIWGGSADLASSTKMMLKTEKWQSLDEPSGRNIAFGIREFGMGAIANGIALHGGTRVFSSTFLAFSDYMKAAIRLSALQKLPVVYVFTHDSIAVGADGPTHQAVEQLMSLRQIPNTVVLRPGDSAEVAVSWQKALNRTDGPTILILARQNLPQMSKIEEAWFAIKNGARVLQTPTQPAVQIIATGSEVALATKIADKLHARVVTMPDVQTFSRQPITIQQKIILPNVPVVSLEAGTTFGWQAIVGKDGLALGVEHFGASGDVDDLYTKFALDEAALIQTITRFLTEKDN